jgi:glycosyltransferase involved in cell wall biosynthesis
MMAGHVSLSVVICTYNRGASLAETLASVNACELPPGCGVELLVVDNNSSDETADICAAFARVARMPFRRVVEGAQGLSFARNRGVKEAAGDVIIFTDDDVLVEPSWLARYALEFREHEVECAFGRIHAEWRGRRPEWFSNALRPAYAVLDYGDSRMTVTTAGHEFFGANFAVRKDLLADVGGFDTGLGRTKGKLHIGEETRVFCELLRRGSRIVYNPAIEVRHVIEESRKDKAYLVRYYRDTASSLVYLSLNDAGGRKLFGMPLGSLKGLATFYVLALPRFVVGKLRRDDPGLFALRLFWIRSNRMVVLYLRDWLGRLTGFQRWRVA